MIGVAVQTAERETAQEFFELFKTPWEFYQPGKTYEVLLCTHDQCPNAAANLTLIYQGGKTEFDSVHGIKVQARPESSRVVFDFQLLPLYGQCLIFPGNLEGELKEEGTNEAMALRFGPPGATTVRVGYDLFAEIRLLLTEGQPSENGSILALDLHIAILRNLILHSGLPLVEIPPAPLGHDFMVCLTHDIDNPLLRNHFCDYTMVGFLGRATVVSLVQVLRGRRSLKSLGRNLAAAVKLPFVYLGLAKDTWSRFDRYLEVEKGLGSTFYVIPRRDHPGRRRQGNAPPKRASRYSLGDIKKQLQTIVAGGGEVGLHGLDAWLDGESAVAERDELLRSIGQSDVGVRMHWLYFDEQSATVLDDQHFPYDSTVGYTKAVGFRTGTAQVYRPLGTRNLMELPLHVMDTAMFYPQYLNLTYEGARQMVWPLIKEVAARGGALTINWHDRSIAPERLWDGFYLELLAELKSRRPWFPTASQAVAWFRKRREAKVDVERLERGAIRVRTQQSQSDALPGLRVRIHKPMDQQRGPEPTAEFVDVPFEDTTIELGIAI